MPFFRKKPVKIEARQWNGTPEGAQDIIDWAAEYNCFILHGSGTNILRVLTKEGAMDAHMGHWIIRGIRNEFYPCEPGIFMDTYEQV